MANLLVSKLIVISHKQNKMWALFCALLSTIKRFFFHSFRNNLQAFPILLAFWPCSHAFKFDCYYGGDRREYYCSASVFSSADEQTLTNVTGILQGNKTTFDVSKLAVYSQFIFYQIPKGIEKFFPSLTNLDFFDGNLITVSSNDLKSFPKLTSLSLSKQRLIILDGGLFKYTLNLEFIKISENPIQHVGKDLLESLKKLTEMNFLFNTCFSKVALNQSEFEELKTGLREQCPAI